MTKTISKADLEEITKEGGKVRTKAVTPRKKAPKSPATPPPAPVVLENSEKVAEALVIVAKSAEASQAASHEMIKEVVKELGNKNKIVGMKVNRKEHKATGIPLIEDIDFYYEDV